MDKQAQKKLEARKSGGARQEPEDYYEQIVLKQMQKEAKLKLNRKVGIDGRPLSGMKRINELAEGRINEMARLA